MSRKSYRQERVFDPVFALVIGVVTLIGDFGMVVKMPEKKG
jgi:hypothetical protein